jgi:AcrR family transcriptional regulator
MDQRVQRTHRLLREAFIALILEKGYNAVTIRDVARRAGVGRSTFYTHFGDLEELLRSHGDRKWLRRFQPPGEPAQPFAFVLPFLEHAAEQRRFLRALVGNKGGAAIHKHFKEALLDLVREEVDRFLPRETPPKREAATRFVAGAFYELLNWWLDSRSGLTPEALAECFHALTPLALRPRAPAGGLARPSGLPGFQVAATGRPRRESSLAGSASFR